MENRKYQGLESADHPLLEDERQEKGDSAASSQVKVTGSARLDYIDQYRGFIMFSMILVNFLGDGHFEATPLFFQHGHYQISYPDTVMPGFLFACGLSYRLSHLKHIEKFGLWTARWKIIFPRTVGLLILSYWLYGMGFKRLTWDQLLNTSDYQKNMWFFMGGFFGALCQIALSMVWCIPAIDKSILFRVIYAIISLCMYVLIAEWLIAGSGGNFNYFDGNEGGFWAFLSWSFPLLSGSIMYDVLVSVQNVYLSNETSDTTTTSSLPPNVVSSSERNPTSESAGKLSSFSYVLQVVLGVNEFDFPFPKQTMHYSICIATVGFGLMLLAYFMSLLSTVVPFLCYSEEDLTSIDCSEVKFPGFPFQHIRSEGSNVNAWSMVEGWPSFMVFNTGFQIVACVGVFWFVDIWKWKVRGVHNMFDAFGRNTLLAYYFHFDARRTIAAWMPEDSPPGIVFIGLVMCMGSLYLACAHLRKNKCFVSI
jgi:predicted acyltransferase